MSLLAVLLLLWTSGCGRPPRDAARSPSPPTSPRTPALPRFTPYEVASGEPAPEVKRAAVRFLEALAHGPGGAGPAAIRGRLAAAGQPTGPADDVAPLLVGADATAVDIVYPQFGGLEPTKASVMAVVRLHHRRGRDVSATTRTLDVRLAKGERGWSVTGVASIGGGPPRDVPTGSPDAASRDATVPPGSPAAAVLADDRIRMPDTARADVRAGRVDDRVLRLLSRLADEHTLSVAVLVTGHPRHVFGSPAVSNHARGRAVDVWAVDGVPVARQRKAADGPARAVTRQALRLGADEVGAPWTIQANGLSTFTNTLHQDHLHIAFDR
ncbi:hypothetical protein [Actinomadura algeriensis]|uniref:Uncharacterized protein n=1 Tax=Actinomadura algeriensis TaxID=1679523 RepID=A0ABR9JR83_9ACTN|nr:hypothetical protein [Actinomadura algeriensis]MBE1533077.1 hypothetical protein [Actinomadura algeriensis]